MVENPSPHTTSPDASARMRDAELRSVKLLDRSVRDDLGGLLTVLADHGQARHFLLPAGANRPYRYQRCLCRKCEWVVGRQPLYLADVVRSYQSIPIPPAPTCKEYNRWPEEVLTGCPCACCEEGRGSHDDDRENVTEMRCFNLRVLSCHLQSDCAGTLSIVHRPIGSSQGMKHLSFEPSYNRNLYELLGVPKPVENWRGFGQPAVKCHLDYGEVGEGMIGMQMTRTAMKWNWSSCRGRCREGFNAIGSRNSVVIYFTFFYIFMREK